MIGKSLSTVLFGMLLISGGCSSETVNPPPQESVKAESIAGDWSGVLDVGIVKVTLVLHIQQEADGTLRATVDTLEQELLGTPIDTVSFDGKSLAFEIKAAYAKFTGSLTEEAVISGQWTQGGQSFPLAFDRSVKTAIVSNRPQEPKLPLPYTVEQVSYDSSEAGVTLSGTLTLPTGTKPAAAVVLIAGSGPLNRDEALLGHKPFFVLSDSLTRRGIAVLRFDKRGCGESTGDYKMAMTEDFAKDALAGVEYLKTRKEIDPAKIGLIGHSEGGLIAPIVATNSKEVAFIVLMAAPGVNGEQILFEQGALIQRAMGETEETIQLSRAFQKDLFALLIQELDPQVAAKQLHQLAKKHIAEHKEGKITLEMLEIQALAVSNTPWFRHFLIYDPTTALRQVKIPVLAINGELDLQVAPTQNLPVIKQALQEAGNEDYTLIELPKLNHLFQTCETGSPAEYAKIEETIAPSVLNLIAEWISERATAPTR